MTNISGIKKIYSWAKNPISSSILCKKKSFIGDVKKLKYASHLEKDVLELTTKKPAGKNIGQIYHKITDPITGKIEKTVIDVDIDIKKRYDQTIYTFKDKGKETGHLILEDHVDIPEKEKIYLLTKDIPEFGIVGDRVIVKQLMNYDQTKYSGIGDLADKIAVQHCQKLGIKPVIISEAAYNSHAAHYKRGKRFIYSDKTNNPNEIVKRIIEETPKGEKCDTSRMGILITYMPDEIIEKHIKELEKNPILK